MPKRPITPAEQERLLTAPSRLMRDTAPAPKASGTKVTIACKIPVPWIDLRITQLVEKDIPGLNGTTRKKEAVATGEFIRIRGTAYPRAGGVPDGFPGKPIMMNGCALTPNVDEDKWLEWLESGGGRKSQMFRNGLIFAHENIADVKAQTAEVRDVLTGLEPLDPRSDEKGRSMDARAPKRTTVGQVEAGQVNKDEGGDSEMQLYQMLEQQEAAVAAREE